MFASIVHTVKDYLKGFFLYGMLDGVYAKKRRLDDLFMAGLFGTCIGFPFLFNYYHLRLMPHYAMRLDFWKRRVLRERDFFDHIRD
ncbi:MAG: hypothetical protein JW821_05520 [Deltaproteobacteria bacterium]|nr:hypothetical protein [Deltaproteobacteria bacterium]